MLDAIAPGKAAPQAASRTAFALSLDVAIPYALFAGVLAAYGYCISGSPASWDNAELQTVPYVLGIPHPTGFPLFVLIGWAFSHIVALGSVAWRMNLLSATCIAVATAGVFRCARLCGATLYGALVGAACFCSGPVVLGKGMHTDVHAMSTMWFTLVLCNVLAYARHGSKRALPEACLCAGFGLATHPTAMWWLPAIVLAAAYRRPSVSDAWRAAGSLVLPLASYLYLPLRSAFVTDPNAVLGLGNAYAAIWNTNDPHTWLGFVREISGSDFGAASTVLAVFDVRRYAEFGSSWGSCATTEFGFVALGLAATGGLALAFARTKQCSILLLAGFGSIPFAFAYRGVEGDVERYLLPSFVVCAIAGALATSSLVRFARRERRLLGALLCGAQFAALVLLVRSNVQAAVAERQDAGGTNTIAAIRRDTPADAIVVASWVDGTSLAYAKYVEHSLGRRFIVIGWPDTLHASFARLARVAPVYVLLPADRADTLTGTAPAGWRTRVRSTAADHVLYRLCAVPELCVD